MLYHTSRGFLHAVVGFMAVAYTSGLLLVVDLRGPRVILRNDSHTPEGGGFLRRHAEHEPIQSLAWTCCALASGELTHI